MSLSFRIPYGSAPLPEIPNATQDGIVNRLIHTFRAFSDEAAVRAAKRSSRTGG